MKIEILTDKQSNVEAVEVWDLPVVRTGSGKLANFKSCDDTMNGGSLTIPEGALLLTQEVKKENLKGGYWHMTNKLGWVIITKESALYRDIILCNHKIGDLVCRSRNKRFKNESDRIALNNIREIYRVNALFIKS